ncbi:hypothetical protein [uncultured Marinobacter sp.]|uniref:DUF7884 domain-containing protein n=1 Tax=uncultured Marinobacter sp. TaxID=187379 RepID=UPI00262B60F6|nr:hypothetical protein [uncultured Marinobacter sp.]
MLIDKLIDNKVERWANQIRETVNVPVLLRLWTGHQYPLGKFLAPSVTLTIKEASALRSILSPTLNSLGDAYVRGKIDLDGDLPDLIRIGYDLTTSLKTNQSSSLVRALERFSILAVAVAGAHLCYVPRLNSAPNASVSPSPRTSTISP